MMFEDYLRIPEINFTSERLLMRLVTEYDAVKLAEYYIKNREYLQPWEPLRDRTYYSPIGWITKLQAMQELHRKRRGYYFAILEPEQQEIIGICNYNNIVRGALQACYLGYSLGEKWQQQGLMTEALQVSIPYMFSQQKLHRIMANYMPYNQRSANLLAKLGFIKEGYAKDYLMINGVWQDHVLTALINQQSTE